MSNPVDFSVKPFARGVLKDIPSQFMPMGGLTHGLGVRIDDAYIEKRMGFRRISDCEYDEYILGLYQYLSPDQVSHVFFGDRHHLYHIGYGPALRFWDDGYPWWDMPSYTWDALAGGVTYELSPWGSTQICPVPSVTSASSSSSSTSESSSSLSSLSVSSSASCTLEHYPFTGRDHRDANGETSTWIFVEFAGNIIATNYEDPIVIIRGFTYDRYENLNCMGLRARIVDNFQSHLMALNTVDDVDGQVVNRIWWSGLDDAEDWDYTNLASESGYADLQPTSMPITGGAKLRDSYIVYQANMIHQMNYVGGTNVFSRQVINKEIGCMSKGLLCSDGEKHFFFAQNEIWMFDGYNFKPIGISNNEYIYGGLNKSQVSRAFSFIDVNTNEAHFVIPWQSDIPNLDCIYDYMHDLWTFDFLDVNGCEGATAGCPKVAFDFPFIARVGSRISSSSSSSSSISSSSSSLSISSSSSASQFPNTCVDCCEWLTINISGFSNQDVCHTCDCDDFNGTFALLYEPSESFPCRWVFGETNPGEINWYLIYDGTTWVLRGQCGLNLCAEFSADNVDGCPPETGWTETDQLHCSGGIVTIACSTSSSLSSSSESSSSSSESSSSRSSVSYSNSSSSDSFSSEGAHADSFIEEVGSTLNDDGWPRVSEWISGEYTTFNAEFPIDQYIKEIRELTPVIVDLANDVHISLGARDRTDSTTVINWETLAAFTQQELVGTTTYGRYLSFRCVASSLNDYYEISELMGSYVVAGRR